ncbi:SEC-C metal-binding domain-containing protein [Haloferula sp. BvORR071]|uniref:SEC-C metal-binding domain-containing protein n=1 Tax=Haloferula sp. BvORR071 TaxID=1396141 RepID=UPI0031B5FFDA
MVNGDKELSEKLGRNDPCPCGSSSKFQELLSQEGDPRRVLAGPVLLGSSGSIKAARPTACPR